LGGTVEFRVLGPLEVVGPRGIIEIGAPKHRALLSLLLIEPGRVVSVDRLIDQLWNGSPPASATTTLQAYVSNVRRALEPERAPGAPATVLVTRPPGYALDVERDLVDARRFERLVAEAAALAPSDPTAASERLANALSLWRGQAFADVADEPWATSEVARLEELRLAVLERQLEIDLSLGRHVAVAIEAERLVKQQPVRERPRELLMLALYRSGRQADALRAFRDARETLIDGLGIEPGPSLRALENKILAQDPSLDWRPTAGPQVAVSPDPVVPAALAEPDREPALDAAEERTAEPPTDAFVGRAHECATLNRLVDDVLTGRGRIGLVAGEPGIGKTRLCEATGNTARERGVHVVWGNGYEGDGAPAFWPWVLILRALAEATPDAVAGALTPNTAGDIARVVPEYSRFVPDTATTPSAVDAETARFRFFDAVAGLLRRLAAHTPLMVVLDDLHWADVSSLRLVEFAANALRDAPVLLLGTYRDTEVGTGTPLASTLSALAREPALARVRLRGLSIPDIATYVSTVVGHDADAGLVASLYDRTGGNPFFVAELVRLLRTEGRLGDEPGTAAASAIGNAVPQGVRDVIRSRLSQLPEAALPVLTAAAVAGRQFDLALIARVCDLPEDDVLDVVEAAWISGIVDEVAGKPGQFEFAHELVRDTLRDGLGTVRRIRLHRAVGEALEALHGVRNPAYLAECAYHFSAAAPGGDALKAVLYGQKAADQLVARLAYEDAIPVYERAIGLVATYDVGTAATRNDLYIGLAWALRSSGRLAEARVQLDLAVDVARSSGDPVRLARSVLGHGGGAFWGWWEEFGVTDTGLIAQLEEAIEALGDDDSWLRCELLGRLAVELYFSAPLERRATLSAAAVDAARRLGDANALAAALAARHVAVWRPENHAERLALADELVDVATGSGLLERELTGRHLRMIDRFEAGDVHGADRELARCQAIAEEIGQHSYSVQLAWFCAMRELMAGNLDESERLAHAAFEQNLAANESAAWMALGAQLFHLRREQGRLNELESVSRQAIVTQAHVGTTWRIALATILVEDGRTDEARPMLDELVADDLAQLRIDLLRPIELRELAEQAAALDAIDAAAALDRHLDAIVGDVLLLGTGHLCAGPTAFARGLVARTLGRTDEAIEHLAHAVELADTLGARPHATRARWWLGRTLRERGGADDLVVAREVLETAAADADRYQLALASRISAQLATFS
jgi:DNA-binding SARP family transcriptional activator/tetratricopeptide (TPR) repeat protein